MAAFKLEIPLYLDFNGEKTKVALLTTDPGTEVPAGSIMAKDLDGEKTMVKDLADWSLRNFPTRGQHVPFGIKVTDESAIQEGHLIPDAKWDAAIVPDYARDTRLLEIVAKLLYEERQKSNGRFLGTPWDDQTEVVKTRWRDYAEKLINEETGHGRE